MQETWQNILWIYLGIISFVTFILFAADKIKAKRNKWRIRESMLLIFSAAGGSAGALLGMLICRHKIRKWYFAVLIPLMLIIHIAAVIYVMTKFG